MRNYPEDTLVGFPDKDLVVITRDSEAAGRNIETGQLKQRRFINSKIIKRKEFSSIIFRNNPDGAIIFPLQKKFKINLREMDKKRRHFRILTFKAR